jgi:hypothetical protein
MWRDTVAKWILHLALDKLMDAPLAFCLAILAKKRKCIVGWECSKVKITLGTLNRSS